EGKMHAPTWATLTPYPGTKIWEYALEHSIVGIDMDWNKFASVSDTMYMCEHVSHKEFSDLIREWLVKNSLILRKNPDRGGSFVIRGKDNLRRAVEMVYQDIKTRGGHEIGDDVVLDRENWCDLL
ncbi:MAG TPA: hypothetical protein PLW83_08920, partial [Deltaproteobacteria bacterium]|nr:hypothetical protein [Deltaproteobacteria bacterium]